MVKKEMGFRRIGDPAVRAKTGKSWEEWFKILDGFGVREIGHTATAKRLRDDYQLGDWWAQAVAIRYEREGGIRK